MQSNASFHTQRDGTFMGMTALSFLEATQHLVARRPVEVVQDREGCD